ncbi:hypothetical protein DSO57_1010420 [Entomophthora muscae]|uniref:Uncharacterized protein n=1 Tax=Entomophthora muscae TaxID=34485 RepID=A0ACC2S8B3_9FUNG|nr:hypothetical protein DSO57_1010420 [Entomophthora muscae]
MKQSIITIVSVSALPYYDLQGTPLSIPSYAVPVGPINLPLIRSSIRSLTGDLPLLSDIFGQQYSIPNGNSYFGAFTTTGPSTVGKGITNNYNVNDGNGNIADGTSYAATIASAPVVDGKQVTILANADASHNVRNFVIPNGQGFSSNTSSHVSYSKQSN